MDGHRPLNHDTQGGVFTLAMPIPVAAAIADKPAGWIVTRQVSCQTHFPAIYDDPVTRLEGYAQLLQQVAQSLAVGLRLNGAVINLYGDWPGPADGNNLSLCDGDLQPWRDDVLVMDLQASFFQKGFH